MRETEGLRICGICSRYREMPFNMKFLVVRVSGQILSGTTMSNFEFRFFGVCFLFCSVSFCFVFTV